MTKAKATKLDKEIQEGLYDPKKSISQITAKEWNTKKKHGYTLIKNGQKYILKIDKGKTILEPVKVYDPLTDIVKREFTVVSKAPKNGFLLNDGTFLSLSEHADILQSRLHLNQNQFMKRTGAMRVESYRDEYVNVEIDVSTTPTLAQWNALSKFPKIFYDFTDGKTVVGHGIVFTIGDLKSKWMKEQKKLYDPKRHHVYKVGWKAKTGFKVKSFWTKKEMDKQIAILKKAGIWYRAWQAGTDKVYDPKRERTYIAWNIKEQKPVGWLGTAKSWVEMDDRLKKYKAPNHITSKRLFDPKPSSLPPARWYEAMVKGIKKSSDVRNPYAIVKSIWSKLSSSKKAEFKAREKKGERFKYDLPLPVDKPTKGTGTVRMVKPFKLAEVQVNLSVKDYLAARASGLFSRMKRHDGTIALVSRCKSPKSNTNIFIDKMK